jgi:hypothetical protein
MSEVHLRKYIKSELVHFDLLVGNIDELLRLLFFALRRQFILWSRQQVLIQSLLHFRYSLTIGFDFKRFQDGHVHILSLR